VDVTPAQHTLSALGAADKQWFLGRHPFFGPLPIETRERLGVYIKTKRFRRGATVFSKGDPGTSLFVVRSGLVRVSARSTDGKDAVFGLFKEGDFFGEIALLDGLPRTANAVNRGYILVHMRRLYLSAIIAACSGCPACQAKFTQNCPNCDFYGQNGPECGHYVNMSADYFAKVACGFSSLGGWAVQNFSQ